VSARPVVAQPNGVCDAEIAMPRRTPLRYRGWRGAPDPEPKGGVLGVIWAAFRALSTFPWVG
jgi:hypothetical protein